MKTLKDLKSYFESNLKNTKISGMALHKASSSFMMLELVDLMIQEYYNEERANVNTVLLDVFGILQGFFVAVDALYDLSISLTGYKYNINLNLNPVLHELKYIRNDIVGHPTNRTYSNGAVGFSVYNFNNFSRDSLTYITYYYDKDQNFEKRERAINFLELSKNYRLEKDQLLKELLFYLKNSDKATDLVKKTFNLYEIYNKKMTIDKASLEEVKALFKEVFGVLDDSKHRFLWRIGLIELLLTFDKNPLLDELTCYMLKKEILKVYKIALDISKQKGLIPYLKIPKVLRVFFRFIRRNESVALQYIDCLNDQNHPHFYGDILALKELKPDKSIIKIFNILLEEKDQRKTFLIGSALMEYKKAN